MSFLLTSRARVVCCLIWCLSWPLIALLLLRPLPFAFVARSDLLAHFLLFGSMAAFPVLFARTRLQLALLAGFTMIGALGLEFGQGYVPSRMFDLTDAAANLAGGIAGCLAALALLQSVVLPATRRAAEVS